MAVAVTRSMHESVGWLLSDLENPKIDHHQIPYWNGCIKMSTHNPPVFTNHSKDLLKFDLDSIRFLLGVKGAMKWAVRIVVKKLFFNKCLVVFITLKNLSLLCWHSLSFFSQFELNILKLNILEDELLYPSTISSIYSLNTIPYTTWSPKMTWTKFSSPDRRSDRQGCQLQRDSAAEQCRGCRTPQRRHHCRRLRHNMLWEEYSGLLHCVWCHLRRCHCSSPSHTA